MGKNVLRNFVIKTQIILQIIIPLYSWLPGIAKATESNEPDQETHLRLDEVGDLARARSPFEIYRDYNQYKTQQQMALPALGSEPSQAERANKDLDPQTFSQMTQEWGTAARIAASEDASAAARGFAIGGTTGYAAGAVQNWLQQFGSAKVDINVDDSMNFGESSLDFLYPIYDSSSRVFFSQTGVRYSDDRWMANLGMGQRHFVGNWMVGYNIFFDQDLTEGHSRAGTGLELWRDYLKLSTNGYFHITSWKDSSQLDHYEARPADGFDMKAEGYLPAYPQLGALVGFEQYYGDEVALFGHDNDRQKNPSAFSYGLTYTPVPLVELTSTYKDGDGGQSETQFGLQFNYALGVPLQAQLDPADVALKRSLAGSRYDLVDRNNTIVLDYRNAGGVKLSLPSTLSGQGNTTVNLQATVQADNGLDYIAWDDASLRSVGGSIMGSGTSYTVRLPVYVPDGVNTYVLSGIAYDKEGHASSSSSTAVSVLPTAIDPSHAQVSASPSTLNADGTSTSTLTVILQDEQGSPLTGQASGFTFNLSGSSTQPVATTLQAKALRTAVVETKSATIGSTREVSPGKYQATITAGTAAGSLIVTPYLNGSVLPVATLVLTADSSDVSLKSSSLHMLLNNSQADGLTRNVAEVTVVDENNNPVPNISVDWRIQAGNTTAKLTSNTSLTGADGTTQIGITDSSAETFQITASVNGSSLSTDVTFTQSNDNAVIQANSLQVTDANTIADGKTTKTASVKIVDGNNNPLSGIQVGWVVDGKAIFAGGSDSSSSASGNDGMASITLTDTQAETVKITATVNGKAQSVTSTYVADSANPTLQDNSLIIIKDASKADGTASNEAQVTVIDGQGNPVSGVSVTWSLAAGSSAILGVTSSTTTDEGLATVAITDKIAESVSITAMIGSSTQTKVMSFTQDDSSAVVKAGSLTVTEASTPADGTTVKTASVIVVDANDTPLNNIQVTWSVNGKALFNSATPTASSASNSSGAASITLTDTKAETVTVTATVNNQSQSVSSVYSADDVNAVIKRVQVTSDNNIADGSSQNAAVAIVLDAQNNPVPNANVTWSSGSTTIVFDQGSAKVQTNQYGIATIKYADTTAGTQTLTATLDNAQTGTATTSFAVNPANISVASIELVSPAAGTKVINDGTSAYTYKAKVVDDKGTAIAGQGVSWSVTGSAAFVGGTIKSTTGDDGYAQISFADTHAETVTLTATLANGSKKDTGNVIAFVGRYTIAVTLDRASALAWDNIATSDTNQYVDATFTVTDNTTGQPASGLLLSISGTGGGVAFNNKAPQTDGAGHATVKAVATKSGSQNITAVLGADTSITATGTWTINPNPDVLGSLDSFSFDKNRWIKDSTMCENFSAKGISDKWGNSFVGSTGGNVQAVVTGVSGSGTAGFNGTEGQGQNSGNPGTSPIDLQVNTGDGSISGNLCLKGSDNQTPGRTYSVDATFGGVAQRFDFSAANPG